MAGLCKVLRLSLNLHGQIPVKHFAWDGLILNGRSTFFIPNRETGFFNRLSADYLWKGATTVSNSGRKRGRARGLIRRRNLNKGQVLGVGKFNMIWPGLNAPVLKGKEIVERVKLPEDKEREQNLIKLRDTMSAPFRGKLDPLDRGWSGGKLPGRSIGPPDQIADDTFENFDTKILEHKVVANMSANFSRVRRVSLFCVTGNGNGLAGFALAKAPDTRTAIRNSKNRAGQRLQFIELCDDHTVFHNFFVRFGNTKIFVERRPRGYGLICHRALKTICQTIGIKDLYAKVEGAINVQNLTKGFFMGLQKQKTHADMANEKKLHLVEMRKENGGYPKIVASPTKCRVNDEIEADEVLDYGEYINEGRVKLKKKKYPPFYTKLDSWEYYLKKTQRFRNHEDVRVKICADNGKLASFFNENFQKSKIEK